MSVEASLKGVAGSQRNVIVNKFELNCYVTLLIIENAAAEIDVCVPGENFVYIHVLQSWAFNPSLSLSKYISWENKNMKRNK